LIKLINLNVGYGNHSGMLLVTGQEPHISASYFTIAAADIHNFLDTARKVARRLGDNTPEDLEGLISPEKTQLAQDLLGDFGSRGVISADFRTTNRVIKKIGNLDGIDRHDLKQSVASIEEYGEVSTRIVADYFHEYFVQQSAWN
jgi:hypothetical protein